MPFCHNFHHIDILTTPISIHSVYQNNSPVSRPYPSYAQTHHISVRNIRRIQLQWTIYYITCLVRISSDCCSTYAYTRKVPLHIEVTRILKHVLAIRFMWLYLCELLFVQVYPKCTQRHIRGVWKTISNELTQSFLSSFSLGQVFSFSFAFVHW